MGCYRGQFERSSERCSSSQSIISFQATICAPHTCWQPNEYDSFFFFYPVFLFLLSLKNQGLLCQDWYLIEKSLPLLLFGWEFEKIELVCFTTSPSPTCVDFGICGICSQHGFSLQQSCSELSGTAQKSLALLNKAFGSLRVEIELTVLDNNL